MNKAIIDRSLHLCRVEKCFSPVKSKLVPLCCDHRMMISPSDASLIRAAAMTHLDAKYAETRDYAKEQLEAYLTIALDKIEAMHCAPISEAEFKKELRLDHG